MIELSIEVYQYRIPSCVRERSYGSLTTLRVQMLDQGEDLARKIPKFVLDPDLGKA